MSRVLPGSSPFAEATYLSFERRVLTTHPEFRRAAPTQDAVDALITTIGFEQRPPSDPRAQNDKDPGLLASASRRMYSQWQVRKRRGGHREIMSPRDGLMQFQRALLRWLGENGPHAHDAAYGFVPERSHADHAAQHVGREVVACIDLEDFFGSVTDLHVWTALRGSLGKLSDEVLHAAIWLATVEVRDRDELLAYERTWTTQACDLIARYVRARFPASATFANSLVSADGPTQQGDAASAAREWALTEGDLYVGFTRTVQFDARWSDAARELSALLCLIAGTVRTVSRRRLVVDVLRLMGLDQWLDERAGPPSVQSLRQFLEADLASRYGATSRIVRPLTPVQHEPTTTAAYWAAGPEAPGDAPAVRVLPQGAPTSPWLANLAAGQLDELAAGYAREQGLVYTRYADDLTFSGERLPPRFVHDVSGMVQACGFRVNRKKIVVRRRHQRQVVTGIVVNDRPSPTGIDRRKLRAILHAEASGRPVHLGNARFPVTRRQLRGHLAYWHMVDPTRVPWPPLASETDGEEG